MADIDYTGMVRIPGGKFEMGSEQEFYNESPAHEVEISSFYLDQCEVTNEEYRKVVSGFESRIDFDGPNQPVTGVSWFEADKYCRAISKRLPTEAEWEYAATVGGKNKFGTQSGTLIKDDDPKEACYNDMYAIYATCDVKEYPPNEFGIYGMTGNAWEWVADVYGDYTKDGVKDPTGPADDIDGKKRDRVLRGGSWLHSYTRQLRAALRLHFPPDTNGSNFGFRCAAPDMPKD
jgi:formylglycine-generating enzyme required for sulfatase activity